ncbi:MAG: hypothetical protein MUD12_12885 [Spirochaetes bacterium]|jgi:hypothetical protein|nr:hypothetical protein [Spirochaetota bacterium]
MRKLDMSAYHPYAEMGKTCRTRVIEEKKIVWPSLIRTTSGDKALVIRVLGKNDIGTAAELWRMSYPEVYGSIHEWILFPEEYEGRVALKENWESDSKDRMYAMILGEEADTKKIVFATMLTKFDMNLQVEASFIAIHPDYRQGKGGVRIWSELSAFYEWMKDTGAEYITVFCETWHNITQYIWFKRMGWKIAGIFPGSYTRWCGDRNEYRGCTVHFYRLINDGGAYSTKPEEWQLIPEIRKLWDCLEEINKQSEEEISVD